MDKRFFRKGPEQPRGSFRLVVNRQYYNQDDPVETGFTFDENVLKAALKNIYERNFNVMTELEENLFNEFWKTFNFATDEGFGVREAADPDYNFYQELRTNNAVFSAFKAHRMQNDMAAMLFDEDGSLKPFARWEKDVQPIADHQVHAWLQTEYDTAVLRAQYARDWRQFENEADVLPNLRWMKTTSINFGLDHMIYWENGGVVRPINDRFWNEHHPGDRWNCKCSLSSTDDPVTDIPTGNPWDEPQPGLNNNPGKDAELFNDKHPYFPDKCKNCPYYAKNRKEKNCSACTNIAKVIDQTTKKDS